MLDKSCGTRRRAILLVVLVLLTGIARGADGQPPDPAASTPAVQLFTGARVIVGTAASSTTPRSSCAAI